MNHESVAQRSAFHPASPTRRFRVQLSPTRRGARLARLLATEQLRSWGLPFEAGEQVVAELAANAVSHGRVPGRDFRLGMTVSASTLRIEVTDARGDRPPSATPPAAAPDDEETGRGLLLVQAYADRWGTEPGPAPCKKVWAELDLPAPYRMQEQPPDRPRR
ncbi:ATP-binding protein [Streptomyces varsoviensis]|uniref:ATP-binding protein n=1 Tax=Streptomyces varsoviensis TaxID=67373 RepID=UPI0033C7A349